MYEKVADGWAKHLDFIVLDVICLEIALTVAYFDPHYKLKNYDKEV